MTYLKKCSPNQASHTRNLKVHGKIKEDLDRLPCIPYFVVTSFVLCCLVGC